MAKLIRNGQVAVDEWKVLRLGENDSVQDVRLPVGPVLVPLAVWQARRRELVHREYEHGWPLGVWLAAGESPQEIEADIDDFSAIALEGSDELAPRLLRERHGYRGELHLLGGELRRAA